MTPTKEELEQVGDAPLVALYLRILEVARERKLCVKCHCRYHGEQCYCESDD